VKTAQQAQANWSGASARASQQWVAGINATTKDQAQLAAAAQPRWLAGVQDAAANNRFANGVLRRGTPYWKSQSEAKSSNYSGGYTAGAANFGSAITKLMNDLPNLVSALPARGDINANLQRSAQLALALHARKGSYKAS
jgi:hypothetical protein